MHVNIKYMLYHYHTKYCFVGIKLNSLVRHMFPLIETVKMSLNMVALLKITKDEQIHLMMVPSAWNN